MIGYLVRRLLGAIPLLLGILTIIFFVVHLAPGDPTARFFNPNVSPEVIEQMRRNLGLDQPLHIQYWKWLTSFLSGDFGSSFAAAVTGSAPGVWSGPVRSSFGVHLVKLESHTPASVARFEDVRDIVRDAFLVQKQREANVALRTRLRQQYRIIVETGS